MAKSINDASPPTVPTPKRNTRTAQRARATPTNKRTAEPPTRNPHVRGLHSIKPFLHQANKIVLEECQNYQTVDNLSWYQTWLGWTEKDLLNVKTMNGITNIICPDLNYGDRSIESVVET